MVSCGYFVLRNTEAFGILLSQDPGLPIGCSHCGICKEECVYLNRVCLSKIIESVQNIHCTSSMVLVR